MDYSIIRIKGARKNYGPVQALKGIDLDIAKGEVVLIIGPSGSGKSTLLRCVNRLENLNSGEIWVGEDRVTGKNANIRKIREEVGMVFQSFNLFPHLSVAQNIALSPTIVRKEEKAEVDARVSELLARVGLSDKADSYPDQLSGGQQQRVAIARALAMSPALVLADEPSGNLDTQSADNVFDLMRSVNEASNTTFLIVTHDPRLAQRCDRIIELVDGNIVADKPNPDVIRRSEYSIRRG
jgi:ABC-type polar amino acid transport system ATPase subunit